MAIMIDYPNPVDRQEGKTGFDIMLHATDDPARLKKDYDSEGCVVVDNSEILQIEKHIRLGLTPILIFEDLKPEYVVHNPASPALLAFQKWVKAWETKNIDGYAGSYASSFTYNKMNLKQYKAYKNTLNKKYDTINVGVKNVRVFEHPKYTMIMFSQNYVSTLRGGRPAFKSSGTKALYWIKEGDTFKIASEDFTQLKE